MGAHAVIDETIVAGEAPDIAHVTAFLRARIEVIEALAQAAREHRALGGASQADLEATIADLMQTHILRELEQEDNRRLHVLIELEGTLELQEIDRMSPLARPFRLAKEEFQRAASRTAEIREQMLTDDRLASIEIRLEIEMLGVEVSRAACFGQYALAGEDYCRAYRQTTEEGYELAATVLGCGGATAWRVFSPFHRIAAYLSRQVQALQQGDVTPEQVLWGHLAHKQQVLEAYPYLRDSHERRLFAPIEWQDAKGAMQRIPSGDWTAEMRMTVLQQEVATWVGIALGWQILTEALSATGCASGRTRHKPALVQQGK